MIATDLQAVVERNIVKFSKAELADQKSQQTALIDKLKRLGARSYETKPIGMRRLLELVDDHAPADARVPS